MNTKSMIILALSVALASGLSARASAQAPASTSAMRMESLLVQPTAIKPENIDGSAVNQKVQRLVTEAFNAYKEKLKAPGANRSQLAADAIGRLEELYREDSKNMSLRSSLGFLYIEAGQPAKAVEILTTVEGKSANADVNRLNLNNIALAYYLLADYSKAGAAYGRLASQNADLNAVRFAGSSYLLAGQFNDAIPFLVQASKADLPAAQKLSALKDLGIAYLRAEQSDKALEAFEEVARLGGLDPETASWMGFTYLQTKRYDDAIRVLEKARAEGAFNTAVYNNLANAYAAKGTSEGRNKAIELYNTLAERDPRNPVPLYNMGTQHMLNAEYQKAVDALLRAVRLAGTGADSPQARFALNNLGFCYEKLNRMADAATYYGRASDLATNNEVFARNAGLAYFRAMNMEMADKYLSRAMSLGSEDEGVALALAEAYSREGRNAQALTLLKPLAEKGTDSLNIWFNIGVLSTKVGDKKGAEAAYRKALEIRPDDVDTLNNLGILLLDAGKFDEALSIFEKNAGTARGSIEAKISMAAALYKANRLNDAVDLWKEIIQAEPSRTDIRINLADGLWNLGLTKDARFHYSTVLTSQPNNARANNGMGLWHLLQADNRSAETSFRRAMSVDPKYLPPYNNLAIALERQNKKAEAILMLERALKIDPNFKDAKANLDRLKSVTM